MGEGLFGHLVCGYATEENVSRILAAIGSISSGSGGASWQDVDGFNIV